MIFVIIFNVGYCYLYYISPLVDLGTHINLNLDQIKCRLEN